MSSLGEHVVAKPWGHEFLAFESDEIALWVLHIRHGMSTSMHAHPKKMTGLVVLSGEIELSFLADSKVVRALDKQMLRRGLFHQSKALSEDVVLFEVGTPNDKGDLVRLKDSFGREALGYEKSDSFLGRTSSHPWVELQDANRSYDFGIPGRQVDVVRLHSLETFAAFEDNDILMFLKGGVGKYVDGRYHQATVPGDIARGKILKQVVLGMESVDPETWLMRIT